MNNTERLDNKENKQSDIRAVGIFEGKMGIVFSGAGVLLLPLTISGGVVVMGAGTLMMVDSARRLDNANK